MRLAVLDTNVLVSGNIKHFPQRDFVVTPAQMLGATGHGYALSAGR